MYGHREQSPYLDRRGFRILAVMDDTDAPIDAHASLEPAEEHFKPTGTIFFVAMFVAALILLWASVYVILISRGATV